MGVLAVVLGGWMLPVATLAPRRNWPHPAPQHNCQNPHRQRRTVHHVLLSRSILILPSFRCRGRGVYMPAVDTSYPALDTEVTKLREGSLLRCEGSYECFAGDPDVSSSTLLRLRLCR